MLSRVNEVCDAYSALIATMTVMPVRPMMAAVSDMAGSSSSSATGLKMALWVFSWKKRYPTYLQPFGSYSWLYAFYMFFIYI